MRFLLVFILIYIPIEARVQLNDFLDNCDWCKKKAKYREPLDIGEWMLNCGKKPKDIWFTMKSLGKFMELIKNLFLEVGYILKN